MVTFKMMVQTQYWVKLLTLAKIKALPPKCITSHCIHHCHTLQEKKKKAIYLKNVFDQAVRFTNFIKSQCLTTQLFNILCDKMENAFKHISVHCL